MTFQMPERLAVRFAAACLLGMMLTAGPPAAAQPLGIDGVGANHRDASAGVGTGTSPNSAIAGTKPVDLSEVRAVRERIAARNQRARIRSVLGYVLAALLALLGVAYLLNRTAKDRNRLLSSLGSVTLLSAALWVGYGTFADYKNQGLVVAGRGGTSRLTLQDTPVRFWMALLAQGSGALLFGLLAARVIYPPKPSDD